MRKRRFFSDEQKIQILKEAEESGTMTTCRKYEIVPCLYYQWKKQFNKLGISIKVKKYISSDPRVWELEDENERLKKIIAQLIQELEVKDEKLKGNQQ